MTAEALMNALEAELLKLQAAMEQGQERLDLYRRTLEAIRTSPMVTDSDFGNWVQFACCDALQGVLPQCKRCESKIHEGPCEAAQ